MFLFKKSRQFDFVKVGVRTRIQIIRNRGSENLLGPASGPTAQLPGWSIVRVERFGVVPLLSKLPERELVFLALTQLSSASSDFWFWPV